MESRPRPQIALVEDDDEIRALVSALLAREGMDAHACRTAADFDALVQRIPVDMALVDIMLPGEDGLSILRRLAARGGLPVIMLSAKGLELDSKTLKEDLGILDIVFKPFSPRELIKTIQYHLDQAPAVAE